LFFSTKLLRSFLIILLTLTAIFSLSLNKKEITIPNIFIPGIRQKVDGGVSLIIPQDWTYGTREDGQGYYIFPKNSKISTTKLTRVPIPKEYQNLSLKDLITQYASNMAPGIVFKDQIYEELKNQIGYTFGRYVVSLNFNDEDSEGYFGGIRINNDFYVVMGIYCLSDMNTFRPGFNTLLASFELQNVFKSSEKDVNKPVLGCWEYSNMTSDKNSPGLFNSYKITYRADGTYRRDDLNIITKEDRTSTTSKSWENGSYTVSGNTISANPGLGKDQYTINFSLNNGDLIMDNLKFNPCS
jgi:hypothetical protein